MTTSALGTRASGHKGYQVSSGLVAGCHSWLPAQGGTSKLLTRGVPACSLGNRHSCSALQLAWRTAEPGPLSQLARLLAPDVTLWSQAFLHSSWWSSLAGHCLHVLGLLPPTSSSFRPLSPLFSTFPSVLTLALVGFGL